MPASWSSQADLFEGAGKLAKTVCCCPELIEHVSKELEKEAQIQKQARKAREEKTLLRNPPSVHSKDGGKGGGKNK